MKSYKHRSLNYPSVSGLLVSLLLLGCSCMSLQAQEVIPAVPEAEPELTIPPLTELFVARQDLLNYLNALGTINTDAFLEVPLSRLSELENLLQPISELVENGELEALSLDSLLDLETELRTDISELERVATTLRVRAQLRDDQLDRLAQYLQEWQGLRMAAETRNAPVEILALATLSSNAISDMETQLLADRNEVLQLMSRSADLQFDATSFGQEARIRRQLIETETRGAEGLPLWRGEMAITANELRYARSNLQRYAEAIVGHFALNGITILLWLVLVGGVTLWLLRSSREKVSEFLEGNIMRSRIIAAFDKPASAALLVALIGVFIFGPTRPAIFQNFILVLIPVPAALLVTTVFARSLRLTIYMLAVALSLLVLKPFYEALPLFTRLIQLLLTFAVGVVIYTDMKRGNWTQVFPQQSGKILRKGIYIVCAILAGAMLLDVLGYVGVSAILRALILGGLGSGLIFLALAYVLIGLLLATLQVPPLSKLKVITRQPWAIIHFVRKLIFTLAFLGWILLTLILSGLVTRFIAWAGAVLSNDLSLGAVTFQLSAFVIGGFVLWAAWLLARFIHFILEARSVDGETHAGGLSIAFSKVLGYLVLVLGFFLALEVMGFDLTRVTVLAGALGVGVGLGLQNIANNFISGIILLFERPIKVNDIAMVDQTLGTVRAIGVRSTIMQTFDGSEVIVPNADFIAKTVVNWTKSNRSRRAEIDVGVVYGTSPESVLEILESVAQSHDQVMKDPQSFATFTGFGDSSLNFRLYAWVSDMSNILVTPSSLRQEILHRLKEADIEIPFPQRDVRVTMSAGSGVPDQFQKTLHTPEANKE